MWNDKNILEDIPIFEELLNNTEESEKDRQRWSFLNQKDRVKNTNKNKDTKYKRNLVRRTLQWMKENQYVVTREDKMKKMVLLTKEKYESFLNEYIDDTKLEQLHADPTDSIMRKLEKIMKNRLPHFWKVRRNEAPVTPRLFAYIKSHKQLIEARPIVEKRGTPTYQLERTIAKWYSGILGEMETSTTVATSVLSRIRNTGTNQEDIYTTYDFKALYPSLKIEPVCLQFYRFLLQNIPQMEDISSLLREVAHIICHESYFRFNDRIYKQTLGVPIGCLMAGVLAEITLRAIEEQKLLNFQAEIKLYIWYIDNILVIWRKLDRINKFTEALMMENYGVSLVKDQHSKQSTFPIFRNQDKPKELNNQHLQKADVRPRTYTQLDE